MSEMNKEILRHLEQKIEAEKAFGRRMDRRAMEIQAEHPRMIYSRAYQLALEQYQADYDGYLDQRAATQLARRRVARVKGNR